MEEFQEKLWKRGGGCRVISDPKHFVAANVLDVLAGIFLIGMAHLLFWLAYLVFCLVYLVF